MASIKQRSGDAYLITVSLGYDSKGKKITRSMTYHPKATGKKEIEREVQRAALDFEERAKGVSYYSGDRMTFTEFIPIWRESWAIRQLTQSVLEDYEYHLEKEICPAIGHIKIGKIKPAQLQDFVNGLSNSGLSPKTVRYIFVILNSVMKFAYKMEVIQDNPCLRCSLPKVRKVEEIHYFEAWQASAFLNFLSEGYMVNVGPRSIEDDNGDKKLIENYIVHREVPLQFQVYFNLAIYGGFRRGELIALTWEDVNFRDKTVTINKAAARVKNGIVIKEPKTESANRTVSLPTNCFLLLKAWKGDQMELALSLGNGWQGKRGKEFDKNPIFITAEGGRMGIETPGNKFRELLKYYNDACDCEEDKLPQIRLHDLRHTSATLMYANGVDIQTISHRMGHSKTSVTMDIYGHALPSLDQSASDTLEKAIGAKDIG